MYKNAKEMISFIETQKRLTPKVSLDRMRKICEIYGNPQENIKYIHVAGTNGKGSIVTFLKNILLEKGYNVGNYVSPYVISFNERISYNNKYISDEDILRIGNYIISKYDYFEQICLNKPTFFEFVTLMAFIYFSEKKNLDYVVLEVGLGGLLDSTNIITPVLSIISNVAYDHMNVLGNTIHEIATNKLGIVKKGIPLITIENNEIEDLIVSTCLSKDSELVLVRKKDITNIFVDEGVTIFTYKGLSINSPLYGFHQCENLAIVIEAVYMLNKLYRLNITDEQVLLGIEKTVWPGRVQIVNKNPLIIIDGSHNIDGITRLYEYLKEIKKGRYLKIVFAVSKDKEKKQMISILDKVANEIIFSSFNYKRSDDAIELCELSNNLNKKIENDLDLLVKTSLEENTNVITVFCGSLYFVSELLPKFSGSR